MAWMPARSGCGSNTLPGHTTAIMFSTPTSSSRTFSNRYMVLIKSASTMLAILFCSCCSCCGFIGPPAFERFDETHTTYTTIVYHLQDEWGARNANDRCVQIS